jgi:hypothetical protein
VLGFARPQRFILSCCFLSLSFPPRLFFLFLSLRFIYFFVACRFATLAHLGSSCVTHMLLIAPTITACSHHSCLLHLFLPSPFDLVVLICSTRSYHQHCFTYYCAFTCCFTNSDNSHKYLVFPLAFPLTYFSVMFFFEFAFLPSTRPPHPSTNSPLCKCGSLKFKTHNLQ